MATTTVLDEETTKKVIRQVEFYFSDSNLPRDKFLSKTITDSDDGMVSLALICSFSRMRGHLGLGDAKADAIPDDVVKSVADTLRSSDFLKISDDGDKVGRKTELPKSEEVIEQLDSRTIAASPLPFDAKLEDVESFFTQIAKVNSVRLPRHVATKNLFCGTALVEFSSEEEVENVLQKTLEFAGANLELQTKKDFDAMREKQEQEHDNAQAKSNVKVPEESNYPKGLIVAFTLKSKSSCNAKQNGAEKPVSEADGSKTDEMVERYKNGVDKIVEENEEKVAEETRESKEKPVSEADGSKTDEMVESDKNGVDKIVEENEEKVAEETPESKEKEDKDAEQSKKGSEKSAMDISREDLKPIFQKFGTVKFIDFSIGAESGYIRFEQPEAAQKARAAAVLTDEGGLSVKNYIASLEPVTGDAEKEYWSRIQESHDRFRGKGHHQRGRGGRHQRGGGRFGRSRDRDSPADRPNKVQKVAT